LQDVCCMIIILIIKCFGHYLNQGIISREAVSLASSSSAEEY